MSYSAADVVGKTLFAKARVPIKSSPWDNAPVIRSLSPGERVGKVYSYLEVKPGRSRLHWMFYDDDGNAFYTEHNSSWFDKESLSYQGLQTLQEKQDAKLSVFERTAKLATGGLVAFGGIMLLRSLISR